MGGTPPLGYHPNGRSLSIVEEDAELVRAIFRRYLDLGAVRLLQADLAARGVVKPARATKEGRMFGGGRFSRGELYAMLSNPIYIGRIRHRDAIYDGQHPPIIDLPLWEAAQAMRAGNRNGDRHVRAVTHPSILAGKLLDDAGMTMIVCHASKGPRRYRYYVSRGLQHDGDAANASGMRIPAREIEALVCAKLAEWFDDPLMLLEAMGADNPSPDATTRAVGEAKSIAQTLRGSDPGPIAELIGALVGQIAIATDEVVITLDSRRVAERLGVERPPHPPPLQITAAATLKRSGLAMRLVLPGGAAAAPRVDDKLAGAIATAHGWWEELVRNPHLRVSDLAATHGVTESWITRTLRLAFLDPGVVDQILTGAAPAHLTLETLRSPASIPALWTAQRTRHRIARQDVRR